MTFLCPEKCERVCSIPGPRVMNTNDASSVDPIGSAIDTHMTMLSLRNCKKGSPFMTINQGQDYGNNMCQCPFADANRTARAFSLTPLVFFFKRVIIRDFFIAFTYRSIVHCISIIGSVMSFCKLQLPRSYYISFKRLQYVYAIRIHCLDTISVW